MPLREILKEMAAKYKAPFMDENGFLKEPHCLSPAPEVVSMDGYFLCLLKIVERGVYMQHKRNRSDDGCSNASTFQKNDISF